MSKKQSIKVTALLGATVALGIAVLPVSVFAANKQGQDTTVVSATVNEILSLSGTTPQTSVTMTAASTNKALATTLSVNCNIIAGYTVAVAASTGKTSALVNNQDSSYTIPSYTTATALSNNTSGWGMAVSGVTTSSNFPLSSTNTYKGLTANNTVVNTGTLSSGVQNQQTIVNYGIAVGDGAAAGSYTTSLTYTLSANS